MTKLILSVMMTAALGMGETAIESSNETRFQLDLAVPQAALNGFLPPGWKSNIATTGAAKDCNLRVIFIDRVTINKPDATIMGKGSNRLVYLAAPVTNPAGENVQLIIGGITEDPADVPGPFGVYLPAAIHTMEKYTASSTPPIMEAQDWVFTASTGERLEMHIKFERGVANKRNMADTKFYSAKNPTFYQISRQEQVLDIMRNPTTNPPDHVRDFSIKFGGGSYAKLFDGTEKVVSWDNILWLNRTVLLP